MTETALIVVAAGSGTRLGRGMPKAFAPIAGAPILEHALRGLAAVDARLVVVVPAGLEADASAIAERAGVAAQVVVGGETRADSVAAGLAAAGDARWVLVHDAARALTPPAQVERVIAALREGASAVVPVLPVVDTVRSVEASRQSDGDVLGPIVDRAALRAMQTPQGFDAQLLRRAYAAADARGASTDDAQLVQALGRAGRGRARRRARLQDHHARRRRPCRVAARAGDPGRGRRRRARVRRRRAAAARGSRVGGAGARGPLRRRRRLPRDRRRAAGRRGPRRHRRPRRRRRPAARGRARRGVRARRRRRGSPSTAGAR